MDFPIYPPPHIWNPRLLDFWKIPTAHTIWTPRLLGTKEHYDCAWYLINHVNRWTTINVVLPDPKKIQNQAIAKIDFAINFQMIALNSKMQSCKN